MKNEEAKQKKEGDGEMQATVKKESLMLKMQLLNARADKVRRDGCLRHTPNEHDIRECLENAKLLHIHQEKSMSFPKGKSKFVVILQEGAIFKNYDAVTVLLITSDPESKDFETNVTIERGTTRLDRESYIVCAQPYTILKSLFEQQGVWCAGKLSKEVLDEVDARLYIGLCMGLQDEIGDRENRI